MIKNLLLPFAILVAGVTTATVSRTYYESLAAKDRDVRMSADIRMAMEKGVDPLVIRCAYAAEADSICLVLASKKASISAQLELGKPKK